MHKYCDNLQPIVQIAKLIFLEEIKQIWQRGVIWSQKRIEIKIWVKS